MVGLRVLNDRLTDMVVLGFAVPESPAEVAGAVGLLGADLVDGVVFHRYEYVVAGRSYRNVEVSRVQGGLVLEVEVYFGGAI